MSADDGKPFDDARFSQSIRIWQLVVGAMAIGLSVFLGFILTQPSPQKPIDPLVLVGVAMAGGAIVMGFVMSQIVVRGTIRRIAELSKSDLNNRADGTDPITLDPRTQPLIQSFFLSSLISGAMLEGAGFVNLFAYMQNRQMVSLAVAGLLIACICSLIPIPGRVRSRIDGILRQIDDERSFQS